MALLLAWVNMLLGAAILVGSAQIVHQWELHLTIGTSGGGGSQALLFVTGLLLLLSGFTQILYADIKSR